MFSLSSSNSFEYYAKPCDMRKGINGLCGLVSNELHREPTNGDVFVFINKPRNTIKLLHWEQDGMVIYYKRLEKGTFSIPKIVGGSSQISWPNFVLMIEGILVQKSIQKTRFLLENKV